MTHEETTKAIGNAIRSVVPDAKVYLYGSRARGDAQPDSDWDILIVTSQQLDPNAELAARAKAYDIEWNTGSIVSVSVIPQATWDSDLARVSPFSRSVRDEAIAI